MPKRIRLLILPRAELDIDRIFGWLQQRSDSGAKNWLSALEEAFQRIVDFPDSLGQAPESELLGRDLKQCLFKTPKGRTYRAICHSQGEEIFILRVRGPGQPPLEPDELSRE